MVFHPKGKEVICHKRFFEKGIRERSGKSKGPFFGRRGGVLSWEKKKEIKKAITPKRRDFALRNHIIAAEFKRRKEKRLWNQTNTLTFSSPRETCAKTTPCKAAKEGDSCLVIFTAFQGVTGTEPSRVQGNLSWEEIGQKKNLICRLIL